MLWTRTGPGGSRSPIPSRPPCRERSRSSSPPIRRGSPTRSSTACSPPTWRPPRRSTWGSSATALLARLDLGRMGRLAWGLEYDHEKRRGNRAVRRQLRLQQRHRAPGADRLRHHRRPARRRVEHRRQRPLASATATRSSRTTSARCIWDNPFRVTGATDPNAYTAPGAGSIGGSNLGFADLAAEQPSRHPVLRTAAPGSASWFANGSAALRHDEAGRSAAPLHAQLVDRRHQLQRRHVRSDESGEPAGPHGRPQDQHHGAQRRSRHPLRAEPGPDLPLSLLRSRQQGPRIEFPGYVRFHAVWEAIGRVTVPYAYTRQNASAEVGWDLARATRLGFAFERESWDRKFREVKTSDEDIWKATFDTRPVPWFALRSSYRIRRPLDRALRRGGRRGQLHRARREPPTSPTCASSTKRPASGTSSTSRGSSSRATSGASSSG